MRVLAVGGGGREHAIVRALRAGDAAVLAALPNRNPGILRLAEDVLPVRETDVDRIVTWAVGKRADLAVVGPEAPLGQGIVDRLEAAGIPAVGPSRAAAQIELSKAFARDLMRRHGIPGLVPYEAFDDPEAAARFLSDVRYPVVVKPIGLTGGKGVRVQGDHFGTKDEALAYVKEVLAKRIGGEPRVLLERREEGEEFSLQAFTDGRRVAPMPAVQDYKRACEGDEGPNTGGMGSLSDADGLLPFLPRRDCEAAVAILQRTVDALRAEGTPYKGVLYGGFILTAEGPRVLEFNARFGDPEAMNVLPLLEEDFPSLCEALVTGRLPSEVAFRPQATVCKYAVPKGYGTDPRAGAELTVDEEAIAREGAVLYYAAVDEADGRIRTTTSRALAVVGVADDLAGAEATAEAALGHVRGAFAARHDIGKPAFVQTKVARMRALRGG